MPRGRWHRRARSTNADRHYTWRSTQMVFQKPLYLSAIIKHWPSKSSGSVCEREVADIPQTCVCQQKRVKTRDVVKR